MEIKLNNTPFTDKALVVFYNKKKLPRKLKKQIKNFHLGKGLFKRNGLLIYDETPSLNLNGVQNLYNKLKSK